MSESPQVAAPTRTLSGRWQIPLLDLLVLAAGFARLMTNEEGRFSSGTREWRAAVGTVV
jgi:hypothetical protein